MHEDRPRKKRISRRKIFKYSILILLVGLLISISAITHRFGPYMGKVVDLETAAPLKGAAVLIGFRTDGIEGSGTYAGAFETVTDSNGEFIIPAQRVFVFHPLNEWNPNGYITIFKPGYGVYPGHDEVTPMFVPNGTIPEKEQVTFKLPELKTNEERKYNLGVIDVWADMPDRKIRNLLRLESQERVELGFSPLPAYRIGD